MNNPHQLAERRHELSVLYARASEQLGTILSEKPREWLKIRQDTKSDKSADLEWDASEVGKEEIRLRYLLKGMEKEISGIKTLLDVLSNESRNQY